MGLDNTGHRTPALTRKLLKKHPNLYMSFKISPRDSLGETCPLLRGYRIKAEWLELISEFPDRFIIGSDQFYLSPRIHGQIGPRSVEPTDRFFSLLPEQLARKIGYENVKHVFNPPEADKPARGRLIRQRRTSPPEADKPARGGQARQRRTRV
ncbi:MAG: hypothetical protein DRH11_05055 [Deltaproteobacteria bacterium]|nr:MAG: hypothetical protein DRH11_05055 [Deltaproteobacteria bacterium]